LIAQKAQPLKRAQMIKAADPIMVFQVASDDMV